MFSFSSCKIVYYLLLAQCQIIAASKVRFLRNSVLFLCFLVPTLGKVKQKNYLYNSKRLNNFSN